MRVSAEVLQQKTEFLKTFFTTTPTATAAAANTALKTHFGHGMSSTVIGTIKAEVVASIVGQTPVGVEERGGGNVTFQSPRSATDSTSLPTKKTATEELTFELNSVSHRYAADGVIDTTSAETVDVSEVTIPTSGDFRTGSPLADALEIAQHNLLQAGAGVVDILQTGDIAVIVVHPKQ